MAAQGIRTWRYEPATWRGEPVGVIFSHAIRFEGLRKSSEWTLSGNPRDASGREQAQAGSTLQQPIVRRFTLPALPWELIDARRPREVTFRIELNEKGRVDMVELVRADPAWEPHLLAAIRTWDFLPGQVGDVAVDWLVQDRVPVDNPHRDLIRTARNPQAIPEAATFDSPPQRLVDPPLRRFKPDHPPPEGGWSAEIDLLVAADGSVAATRVHATNDPAYALHVRSLAPYTVYAPHPPGRAPTAFWIREHHTQRQ